MGEKRLCALAGIDHTRGLGARAEVEFVHGRDQIADQRIANSAFVILLPAYADFMSQPM